MSNQKRIFIAEDDHLLLKILKRRFEDEGYKVETARDGQELLNKLADTPCDLLLLDLLMPVKNGLEVLQELQGASFKAPIVVFSNFPKESAGEKALALGAAEYYEKATIDIEDLVGVVKKHLA